MAVHRSSDQPLLRRALKILQQVITDDLPMRPMTITEVRITITKLEERLLRE